MRLIIITLLSLPFCLFAQDFSDDWDDWDDGFYFEDDGITITGTMQTSQQMAVIGKEEIERHAAADIADLLQDTLNLNIVRYGAYGNQTGINLRGFDSKRVAFLIDGVPANSSLDGKFNINQIDLNSVERIEVIYGGSDSKFNVSGALGGVINIITVKKQNPGWQFGGSVSNTSAMPGAYRGRSGQTQSLHWEDLLDTQNISLFSSYGGDSLSFSANAFANRAQNHFLFNDYAGFVRRKDNNEVWDTGAAASLALDIGSYSRIISSSGFYYGDRNFPSSGFSSDFGNQQDFSLRQSLMFEAPRAFRDDLAAEASVSWNFNRLDYTPPVGKDSRHDQHGINAANRWSWYAAERLTLIGGVNYRYIFLESTEIKNTDSHDGGFFLTAEYKPLKQLYLIPSIKAVFVNSGGLADIAFIPKFGILWNVTDSLAVKNNYFRSFKFPDFEELYWLGHGGGVASGNPNLKPEDGWGGDIGADWRITEKIQLESTFFTQWILNSIHWYPGNNGVWQPENVGKAVFFGLDTKVNFGIPVNVRLLEKITLSFSYQYLRSYLLSFGYTFDSDKRIPYNPEHTIGGSVDLAWKSGSVLISGHFESPRYHDRANYIKLNPCFLLNANVNQNIGSNINLFCSLRNILNTSYESFYDYPMPGFTLTLGLKYKILLENESHKDTKAQRGIK